MTDENPKIEIEGTVKKINPRFGSDEEISDSTGKIIGKRTFTITFNRSQLYNKGFKQDDNVKITIEKI